MEIRKSPYRLLAEWVKNAKCTLSEKQGAVLSNTFPVSMSVHVLFIDDGGIIFHPDVDTIPGHPIGRCCIFFWQKGSGRQVSVIGNVEILSETDTDNMPIDNSHSNILYHSLKKIVQHRGLFKAVCLFISCPKRTFRLSYRKAYILKAETFEFVKPGIMINEYRKYSLINQKWEIQ